MRARVLVVDDERDVGRLLTYSLDQAGFEAQAVNFNPQTLPFDPSRIFWGGFKPILSL